MTNISHNDEILYWALGQSSNSHLQYVILVRSGLLDQVLKSVHDGIGGHYYYCTEERVRNGFIAPGIRQTVTKHIQLCNVCNHKNSPINRKTAIFESYLSYSTFYFLGTGLHGTIAKNKSWKQTHSCCCGSFHQVVWGICNLWPKSKYSCFILVSRIFSRFGPPAVLHSDQGRNF